MSEGNSSHKYLITVPRIFAKVRKGNHNYYDMWTFEVSYESWRTIYGPIFGGIFQKWHRQSYILGQTFAIISVLWPNE